MRWIIILVVGLVFLSIGVALAVAGPLTPVYYVGEPTTVLNDGSVIPGTFTPDYWEFLVPTLPNTLHLNFEGYYPLDVQLESPNGTIVKSWSNYTVKEDYTLSECGVWHLQVTSPGTNFFRGNFYTTAPLIAHPSLIYASGALLLGSLTVLFAKNKRKLQNDIKGVLFEQNIGGRWVFGAWLPIFYFIVQAPYYIPSYPWLYSTLIVATVIATASSIALAYVKLYVTANGIFIEAPFINLSKHYNLSQVQEFEITKQPKQHWFLLYRLPNLRKKKEDYATMYLLGNIPLRLRATVFGARLSENSITLRPKALEKFKTTMNTLNISEAKLAPAEI